MSEPKTWNTVDPWGEVLKLRARAEAAEARVAKAEEETSEERRRGDVLRTRANVAEARIQELETEADQATDEVNAVFDKVKDILDFDEAKNTIEEAKRIAGRAEAAEARVKELEQDLLSEALRGDDLQNRVDDLEAAATRFTFTGPGGKYDAFQCGDTEWGIMSHAGGVLDRYGYARDAAIAEAKRRAGVK